MIDWYPTIDPTLCQVQYCQYECVHACPRHIFEIDSEGSVLVARPNECTVGDISCSFACPMQAISFPTRADLKQMLSLAKEKINQ